MSAGAPAAGRYVGQAIKRKEDPRLLTGHGRYLDDVVLPRMVHAAFVRSDLPSAGIRSIDVEAALALEGVVAVFTGAELNPGAGSMQPSMILERPDAVVPPLPSCPWLLSPQHQARRSCATAHVCRAPAETSTKRRFVATAVGTVRSWNVPA